MQEPIPDPTLAPKLAQSSKASRGAPVGFGCISAVGTPIKPYSMGGRMMSQVEEKLKQMGYELSEPLTPAGNYIPGYRAGNLVFLAGVGPRAADGSRITGKIGQDLTVEQGYQAARQCALNLLTNLKSVVGDLDNVKHIVKVLGMVNGTPDFGRQPEVINGCSDLLVEVFGERGRHARAAVGMGSLPGGIPVEIEMIVELE